MTPVSRHRGEQRQSSPGHCPHGSVSTQAAQGLGYTELRRGSPREEPLVFLASCSSLFWALSRSRNSHGRNPGCGQPTRSCHTEIQRVRRLLSLLPVKCCLRTRHPRDLNRAHVVRTSRHVICRLYARQYRGELRRASETQRTVPGVTRRLAFPSILRTQSDRSNTRRVLVTCPREIAYGSLIWKTGLSKKRPKCISSPRYSSRTSFPFPIKPGRPCLLWLTKDRGSDTV